MLQYDSQAAQDARAAQAAATAKKKAVSQMSMAELRSEGLSTPLDAENRCARAAAGTSTFTGPSLTSAIPGAGCSPCQELTLRAGLQCRGFKLLQRMGYQQGQGVGSSSAGRTAPLDVVLKPGRTGVLCWLAQIAVGTAGIQHGCMCRLGGR